MVTHYGNSACEGSSPYQLKMAAPAEVSKKRSNFRIRQFYEKRHFNIAANLTLNTMVSFIILLIARTARIVCPDRQRDRTSYTPTQSSDVHAHSDFASTWRYNYLHCARVHELLKNLIKKIFNKVGGASNASQ